MNLVFTSVFIIDEHSSSNLTSQITTEPYIPSNIISITSGGWLNSDEKWFLSSRKDCFKEHVMLCTWPSGIMINLTERKRHMNDRGLDQNLGVKETSQKE